MDNEKNFFKINQPENPSEQPKKEKKDETINYREMVFNVAEKRGFFIDIAPTGSIYFYHPKTKESMRLSDHYDPRLGKDFKGTEIIEENRDIRFLKGLCFFTKGEENRKYRKVLEEKETERKKREEAVRLIKEQKNNEAIDFFRKNKEKIFEVKEKLLDHYESKKQKTWYERTAIEELLSMDDPILLYKRLNNLDINRIWRPMEIHDMNDFFKDSYFDLKRINQVL